MKREGIGKKSRSESKEEWRLLGCYAVWIIVVIIDCTKYTDCYNNLFRMYERNAINYTAIVAIYIKFRGPCPQANIPTERPPLVDEIYCQLCGYRGVAWSARRITYGR
jgi:hypothetical protein